jgi:hypothetical protein
MTAFPVDLATRTALPEFVKIPVGPGFELVEYVILVDRDYLTVTSRAAAKGFDVGIQIETLEHFVELLARIVIAHEIAVVDDAPF